MLLISLLVKFSLWPAKKLQFYDFRYYHFAESIILVIHKCSGFTIPLWLHCPMSMYLNLPSCKIQQSFKAQRMFSLSTTFKKCSRKEAGAHYKTCVKTKVARRNHSSASELTSSSKYSSDIESSRRLVHPTHVHSYSADRSQFLLLCSQILSIWFQNLQIYSTNPC